jgi:acyl-CoA dehydrogenase
MSWEFETDPGFQPKLDWMDELVRTKLWPLETLTDELSWPDFRRALRPIEDEVKEAGLWAAHLDPELGGQGFGQVQMGLMNEILGTSPIAPFAFGAEAPDSGNSEILAIAGSEEQKQAWLTPLLDGEMTSAFSMTEPGTAGSDPTLLKTRAVPDGSGWRLNGHKWFSSNASVADFLIVMAVTDPDAAPHTRSSMFVVPTSAPGVNILRDVPTMEHPTPSWRRYGNHAEIRYEDVLLPSTALLGARGEGFAIAQKRLYPGRIHHCMRWMGICRRAFDMLCERSLARASHGSLLSEKQAVTSWIADSAAQISAAKLMTLQAAWKMDTKGVFAARQDISLIKFYGAQVLHDVIDRAIQVHGALGYSTDLPLEAMYRTARAARLVDGADEVHRESVARQILKGYSVEPGSLPREHIPTRRDEARTQFAWLLETVSSND